MSCGKPRDTNGATNVPTSQVRTVAMSLLLCAPRSHSPIRFNSVAVTYSYEKAQNTSL
jgi:hypothetical protein